MNISLVGKKPDLYHETILAHNRAPRNFSTELQGKHLVHAVNNYCGDKYDLSFDLDGTICRPRFNGHGCAVSKASTSILTEVMNGLTIGELNERCRQFLRFVKGDGPCPAFDPRLAAFAAVLQHPGRERCATLVWESVLDTCDRLLDQDDSV